MKILVVGRFYDDSFADLIAQTLERLGHSVSRFECGLRMPMLGELQRSWAFGRIHALAEQWVKSTRYWGERLAARAREEQPELVLSTYDYLTSIDLRELRNATKAKVALWFPDAVSNFGRAAFFDAGYDYVFLKEPFVVPNLRREIGLNVFYLPECCNVPEKPLLSEDDRKKYGCDITTAGNAHTARTATLRRISDLGTFKIWGSPLPRWTDTAKIGSMFQNEYVAGLEKSKAFLAAKIVLNTIHPTEVEGVNARLFEIAGVGAFQLATFRTALPSLFEPGKEVIVFHDVEELREKIRYYLAHDAERDLIAENGRKRARAEHTYEARVGLLLRTVEGQAAGWPVESV